MSDPLPMYLHTSEVCLLLSPGKRSHNMARMGTVTKGLTLTVGLVSFCWGFKTRSKEF